MTIGRIDESQRGAARAAGIAYLLALAASVFAEFYVNGQLIVSANSAQIATNIMTHERLFRLGIASNLVAFAADGVLLVSLYVVLKPISRSLALVAAGWRLVETLVLVSTSMRDLDALRVLSGADYLRVFEPEQLQALSRMAVAAHGAAYNLALFFFGLGSTMFCLLWFKSRYIPRALAACGVLSSLLVAACTFSFLIFPYLATIVSVGVYAGPIFFFELTLGLWLLLKGLPYSVTAEPERATAQPKAGAP